MTLLKLAIRNLIGAGLRTVLNVLVLALTFLAIVASLGLLEGMNEQTSRAMMEAEYGGGQFWHPAYDPYDPITLEEAHGVPPSLVVDLIRSGQARAREEYVMDAVIDAEGANKNSTGHDFLAPYT